MPKPFVLEIRSVGETYGAWAMPFTLPDASDPPASATFSLFDRANGRPVVDNAVAALTVVATGGYQVEYSPTAANVAAPLVGTGVFKITTTGGKLIVGEAQIEITAVGR